MRALLKDKNTLRRCHIYGMLYRQGKRRHVSFHTPGHKNAKRDITELSYSDNLSCPRGCIAAAEEDIAAVLGAKKSFLLTDGSTSGVLSMLYAAKRAGARTVALLQDAHKSFWNGCALLALTPLVFTEADAARAVENADALFITSPDYYGNIADWKTLRALCDKAGKLLLVDGAHGGHLHFDRTLYAGAYADIWVDGVHKSLPACTQGAVVSARTDALAEYLRAGVDIFRTTSPSYPIMASVEYAVKYPENRRLPKLVRALAEEYPDRVRINGDWTKVCLLVGKEAFAAQTALEKRGIYPEFCDGEIVMFYLSPATTKGAFRQLRRAIAWVCQRFPYEKNALPRVHTPLVPAQTGETEKATPQEAVGRICAADCGLFPPCTPLIKRGERVTQAAVDRLCAAPNAYGLIDGKLTVFKEERL